LLADFGERNANGKEARQLAQIKLEHPEAFHGCQLWGAVFAPHDNCFKTRIFPTSFRVWVRFLAPTSIPAAKAGVADGLNIAQKPNRYNRPQKAKATTNRSLFLHDFQRPGN